ncbi:hypothetical protein BKD30_12615 [Tersicoccus phoenicis]|uniref:Response regulatory domain-containing protein n=1 Tax=Tersicoccus phoenicis TaxID=554083 RepID=A0A1R1L7P7_9MICC|nr:response regulator [Tersicoccus phoenicis]OMH23459.1 hypothetical protein BKD30_12615 [Tersicoccus phoenicis]
MTAAPDLRIFVVEDDPLTASLHGEYVRRVPGFTLVGTAHTRREAVAALLPSGPRADPARQPPADLVLLDMNLPDGHGLAICRMLRAGGAGIDVLAITAATELPVVREAIALGVVQYLIKPFGFAAFEDKLRGYAAFRAELAAGAVDGGATQDAVDAALTRLRGPGDSGTASPHSAASGPGSPGSLGSSGSPGSSRSGPGWSGQPAAPRRTPSPPGSGRGSSGWGPTSSGSFPPAPSSLPKGLSETTLAQVADLVAGSAVPLSAAEVHAGTGIARVTARRYLEYLAAVGRVEKEPRYGSPGRPEMGYRWHP